ncbi:hypothetical protein [Streptomyces cavernae]|uniref:hypothetical protein n=1 Tax=Streptomyces cavernae TaxID=2259034 RepID=UPI000FEC03D1|nr:hypothetical protein [Streptomyces cavernae]
MERLYKRGSRHCGPDEIEPGVRDAIAAHAETQLLGDVFANAVACCATVSTRLYKPTLRSRLKGLADPDPEHHTTALFTPHHLVVAVTRTSTGTVVLSARLDDLAVSPHSALAERVAGRLRVPEDSGVNITAPWSGRPERGSYHVALGDDADGRAFLQALRQAITAAKTR